MRNYPQKNQREAGRNEWGGILNGTGTKDEIITAEMKRLEAKVIEQQKNLHRDPDGRPTVEPVFDWINPGKATPAELESQAAAMEQAADRIREAGKSLVLSGKFIEDLENQFQKIWCGDGHILQWIIHAFAAGFVTNNDEGLHLYVAGASGLGKSESVKHALSLLPKEYVISGSFSRKGLLYLAEKMMPCSIVLMDDHTYDEDEAGIYRAMLAGWREPTTYYTVDRASKEVHIKQRITQITTSADGLSNVSSEGQNESRFSTIEIQRTGEQLKAILDFIRTEHEPISKDENERRLAAWQFIIDNPRDIEIPFSKEITVSDESLSKFREFKKFLCLIRASALLHGRTIATQADFHKAQKLWTYLLLMLDNETAGFPKSERVVFETIMELSKGGKRVRLSTLKSTLSKMNESNIYRALRGREGTFSNATGGLLSKVRGMSVERVYDKDSGEHDQIITVSNFIQCLGVSPYSLELVE